MNAGKKVDANKTIEQTTTKTVNASKTIEKTREKKLKREQKKVHSLASAIY